MGEWKASCTQAGARPETNATPHSVEMNVKPCNAWQEVAPPWVRDELLPLRAHPWKKGGESLDHDELHLAPERRDVPALRANDQWRWRPNSTSTWS
eukprot:SAG11_NODE_24190_length_377_cov_0.553957_1_plen_95_part_01